MTFGKFGQNSRYVTTPIARRTGPDGVAQPYLRRRFLPEPVAQPLGSHLTAEGDRIDRIAAATLGDPLLWWRLADTNRAFDPADLTVPINRRLRIAVEADPPPDAPEDSTKDGGS